MGGVANTIKVFQFAIEIDGIDQFLIQEVKRPEVERQSVEHGAEDTNLKTAGGKTVGDAELRMVKSAEAGDKWAWNWLNDAGTQLASKYKKDVVFKELAPDGKTTLNSWLWVGVWVKKISEADSKRGAQGDNMIQTVTLSVDDVKPV